MKLNVGCGNKKLKNWLNLDINPLFQPEIIRDLRRGLPWSNDVFDEIRAHHILEHFSGEDFIFIMNEFHRVLKPEGFVDIELPMGDNAIIDPNHKLVCNPKVFNFFIVPDDNSYTAGVRGIFKPISLEIGDRHFNWKFKKISNKEIKDYIDKHTILNNNGSVFHLDNYLFTDLRKEK